jgi:hypothetical protein
MVLGMRSDCWIRLSLVLGFVTRGNLKPIEFPIKQVGQEEPRWLLQLDGGTPLAVYYLLQSELSQDSKKSK